MKNSIFSKQAVPQKPIRVGIVGFGYATKTFHIPLIRATEGLQLAGISSSHLDRVRKDLGGVGHCADIFLTEDAETLFEQKEIDLVVIPTPNETHYDLTKRALFKGKHVVVDKPFTVSAKEAQELTRIADEREQVLSIFHNRRYDGDFMTVKKLLEEETLGRIVHFETHFDRFRNVVRKRWRESNQPGAGLWYDLGSHLLDQTIQLFGKPQSR